MSDKARRGEPAGRPSPEHKTDARGTDAGRSERQVDPRNGMQIGGFAVDSLRATSTLADVYGATGPDGTPVVVSVLKHTGDPRVRARVLEAASRAQTVRHPNIDTVLDSGEYDGLVFVVKRSRSGESLDQKLRRDGPLEIQTAVRICSEVAGGLDALWAAGIAHSAISPASIRLDEHGRPYVSDIGLEEGARNARSGSSSIPGGPLGPIDYMAPEQIRGDAPTAATYVYALGAVLFECVCGKPPFADRQPITRVLWAHLQDDPPDPCQLRTDLPAGLGAAIQRALAKDPAERPQTPGALAHELVPPARYRVPTAGGGSEDDSRSGRAHGVMTGRTSGTERHSRTGDHSRNAVQGASIQITVPNRSDIGSPRTDADDPCDVRRMADTEGEGGLTMSVKPPLPADGAAFTDGPDGTYGWRPLLDRGYLTSFWNGNRMLVGLKDSVLDFQGAAIALDTIVGVSYQTWRSRGPGDMPQENWSFMVTFNDQRKVFFASHSVLRGKRRAAPDNAQWWGLVDISQKVIEPRLCESILKQLRAGQPYRIETRRSWIELSANGVEIGRRKGRLVRRGRTTQAHYAWSQLGKVEADHEWVQIYARRPEKKRLRRIYAIRTNELNAVLLPYLLPACFAVSGAHHRAA